MESPRELEYSFVKRMCSDINFEEDYPLRFYGDWRNTRFSSNTDYVNYYYNIYKTTSICTMLYIPNIK